MTEAGVDGIDPGPARNLAAAELDEREYFLTGRWHVEHVLGQLRGHFDPTFAPQRVLDIGCGRGRVALAFAECIAAVTATDPDLDWLERARTKARAQGVANVQWLLAGTDLSGLNGRFDLVHACAAAPERREQPPQPPLGDLAARLAPSGLAAVVLDSRLPLVESTRQAVEALQRCGVRRHHVERGTGAGGAGAMLYFCAPGD